MMVRHFPQPSRARHQSAERPVSSSFQVGPIPGFPPLTAADRTAGDAHEQPAHPVTLYGPEDRCDSQGHRQEDAAAAHHTLNRPAGAHHPVDGQRVAPLVALDLYRAPFC